MWILPTRGNVPLASVTDPTTQEHPFRPSQISQGLFLMIKISPLLLDPFLLAEHFQSPHLGSCTLPFNNGRRSWVPELNKAELGIRVAVVGGLIPPPFEEEAVVFNEGRRIKPIPYDTGQTAAMCKGPGAQGRLCSCISLFPVAHHSSERDHGLTLWTQQSGTAEWRGAFYTHFAGKVTEFWRTCKCWEDWRQGRHSSCMATRRETQRTEALLSFRIKPTSLDVIRIF